MSRPLGLEDIVDLRAYERVRDDYRRRIIELKRRRRVPLGPLMTVVFECPETVRFQIQEMARAERIATDEALAHELAAYNPLLPTEGELSATLFIELTTEEDLRRWLPALVGIETAVALEVGPDPVRTVAARPEAAHAAALTREQVTAAVHYLRFAFGPEDQAALAGAARDGGPVRLVARHPDYQASTDLAPATVEELRADLEGRSDLGPLV